MPQKADEKYGPWNPGIGSDIPRRLLPKSTIFAPENVATGFDETFELARMTGLPPHRLSKFRLERLLIHELLIRVTCDLSVVDGPEYEALGINLRGMVHCLFENHFKHKLATYLDDHDALLENARTFMRELVKTRSPATTQERVTPWFARLFSRKPDVRDDSGDTEKDRDETINQRIEDVLKNKDGLKPACAATLKAARHAFLGKQGFLPRDNDLVINTAMIFFNNDFGARHLRQNMAGDFRKFVEQEGYRFLPAQEKPVVLNVKGASAAGKSTIRPQQRKLAQRLGVEWEDFALVSPDYWRKYLLEYEALGTDNKYGAMLTGRELEIIDRKLDDYMAQKAATGTMPHLLIDRFRFDSFAVDDRSGSGSSLLSRFGNTIFLFFMITPPHETVERAWKRGHSTGRYKAVDDLLYHNVEAYTGMPELFLSWALSNKRVHWEFLDNDVALGEKPRCVAFGWNDEMTVLDIRAMANIDRFRDINLDADCPDKVYNDPGETRDFNFLVQCAQRLASVSFASRETGQVYAKIRNGKWQWCDHDCIAKKPSGQVEKAGFQAMGWDETCPQVEAKSLPVIGKTDMKFVLGEI